jgi:hypothetical protein
MSTKPNSQTTPAESFSTDCIPDLEIQPVDAADVRGGGIVMEFARPTSPAEPPDIILQSTDR